MEYLPSIFQIMQNTRINLEEMRRHSGGVVGTKFYYCPINDPNRLNFLFMKNKFMMAMPKDSLEK